MINTRYLRGSGDVGFVGDLSPMLSSPELLSPYPAVKDAAFRGLGSTFGGGGFFAILGLTGGGAGFLGLWKMGSNGKERALLFPLDTKSLTDLLGPFNSNSC